MALGMVGVEQAFGDVPLITCASFHPRFTAGVAADAQLRLLGHREAGNLRLLTLREEPIGDAALIEDLDGACLQAARTRAGEVLAGAPLDNGHVGACQRQLAASISPVGSSNVPASGRR
jgi:hypothetical protein